MIIFLDPGHGGKDSGAIGYGLYEKNITLDICKRIANGLEAYDCTCILSRSTDEYIPLEQRTTTANKLKARVLVSVHINAATAASARGFESYIYTSTSESTVSFQNVMHREIMKAIGNTITDRGKKRKNLHMLRDSAMNAILTENLFVSNSSDVKLLKDDTFLKKLAQGHINGLVHYLGLKENGTRPIEKKIWTVQAGSFEEKSNAENLYNQLIRDGYKPFIKEEY